MGTNPVSGHDGAVARTTSVGLLNAVEDLIAERGVYGTSLRAITSAAGVDSAAEHTHIDSKHALVQAAVVRRSSVIDAEHAALLEPIKVKAPPSLREVADALAAPFLRLASHQPAYVHLLAALSNAGGEWLQILDDAIAGWLEHFDPAIDRAAPGVPSGDRATRFCLAAEVMVRVLSDTYRDPDPCDTDRDSEVGVLVSAILALPTRP